MTDSRCRGVEDGVHAAYVDIERYAWLAPMLPIIWFLTLRRLAPTAVSIIQVAASNRLMRPKGIPECRRREMIVDAAWQHLESS
jgi:hypothetical protein